MIKVFLASSSRFRPENGIDNVAPNKLNDIIQSLKLHIDAKRLKVKIDPWWECPILKKTDFILKILNEIVNHYDCGIFILGKDVIGQKYQNSITKDNDTREDDMFPNHNVIAELAMFYYAQKKIYIISEDSEIKIPSDFSGLNPVSISDIEGIKKGFIESLKGKRNDYSKLFYGKCCVYYNPELSDKFIKFNAYNHQQTGPKVHQYDMSKWESKALFVGSKSAFLWQNIEEDPDYPEKIAMTNFTSKGQNRNWDQDSKINDLNELEIDNIISFGPGIGTIDNILLASFIPNKPCYIPIDLNVFLAIESMKSIKNYVPFAIIDDFETSLCYDKLSPFLESNKLCIGINNMFSMLGVTFSNLSMNCDTFFYNMKSIMKDEKDYLLLDVIIKNGLPRNSKGKRTTIANRVKNDVLKKIKEQKGYWELIQNSIKKKGLDPCEKPEDLDIGYFESSSNEYKTRTNISDTIIVYVKHQNNIITIAKYYDYESFKKYVQQYFDLVASAKYAEQSRGVFLLKPKPNIY